MDNTKTTTNELIQVIMNDAQLQEKIIINLIKMFINRNIIDITHESLYVSEILNKINEYGESVINLDNNERERLGTDKIHIKFINRKITTIRRVVDIENFMNKSEYKIVIVSNVASKAIKQFLEYSNTELFYDYELHINLIDYVLIPKHIKLNDIEKQQFIEAYNFQENSAKRMFVDDAVSKYYKFNIGDIIRIERPSINSGWAIDYRVVVANLSS